MAALCVAQTTSWGLLYYSLPTAVAPIQADTGWSAALITSAFSAGLIVSAVVGIQVGRLLDKRGPRLLMFSGSLVGVGALLLVAAAPNLPIFFCAWLIAGVAQSAVLYQPAFTVITRWYGPERVRALTTLTLVAGFASTIYVPLTAFLIQLAGWRVTYVLLAVLLAVVTLPLHWFFLNSHWSHHGSAAMQDGHDGASPPSALTGDRTRNLQRTARFRFLQVAMALSTFALFAVTINIIPLLLERGADYSTAALALGLIGVGQVAGRLGYSALAKYTPTVTRTAVLIGAGALCLWGAGLIAGPVVVLVGIAMISGTVRGCNTLLQATAVADRWGTKDFGALNGVFAAPITILAALGPAAGPIVAAALGGYAAMVLAMAALASLGFLAALRS